MHTYEIIRQDLSKRFNDTEWYSGMEFFNCFDYKNAPFLVNLEDVDFSEGKHAVVIIGATCTGKSTMAKEFKSKHPEFEVVDCDIVEDFSERLSQLNNEGKNIYIDGNFFKIGDRIALMNTFYRYGYKVHIRAMSIKTLNDRIHVCSRKRAIDMGARSEIQTQIVSQLIAMESVSQLQENDYAFQFESGLLFIGAETADII